MSCIAGRQADILAKLNFNIIMNCVFVKTSIHFYLQFVMAA